MCECEKSFFSANADDYSLFDLGVIKEGEFNAYGVPEGWEVISEISSDLPRWLLKEPVITLDNSVNVYVRGMWSKRLTAKRAAIILRNKSN